jgi:hypothetical protein
VQTDRGGSTEVKYIYEERSLRNRSGAPVVTSDHGSRKKMDSHSKGEKYELKRNKVGKSQSLSRSGSGALIAYE